MEAFKNVAYYRVSTKVQEQSGLGLDAQKNIVLGYLRKKPDYEFIETESGKNSNRDQLNFAIEKVKELGINGRLIIAKLDRLSRNVKFIADLMESKIDFVCCDNPNATPFLIHILAAFAENEVKTISKRTKEALQEKVRRERINNPDFRLGPPSGPLYEKMICVREGRSTAEEEKRKVKVEYLKRESGKRIYRVALRLKSMGYNASRMKKGFIMYGEYPPMGGIWTNQQTSRTLKIALEIQEYERQNKFQKEQEKDLHTK